PAIAQVQAHANRARCHSERAFPTFVQTQPSGGPPECCCWESEQGNRTGKEWIAKCSWRSQEGQTAKGPHRRPRGRLRSAHKSAGGEARLQTPCSAPIRSGCGVLNTEL